MQPAKAVTIPAESKTTVMIIEPGNGAVVRWLPIIVVSIIRETDWETSFLRRRILDTNN